MAGNRSIVELLARTGGKETSWRESSRTIFRPRFMTMTNKDWKKYGGEREWRNRGNRIDVVRGGRAKGGGTVHSVQYVGCKGYGEEYEQERRSCFARGVSVRNFWRQR